MNAGFIVALSSLSVVAVLFIGMLFVIAIRGGIKAMTPRDKETISSMLAALAGSSLMAIIFAIVGLWI